MSSPETKDDNVVERLSERVEDEIEMTPPSSSITSRSSSITPRSSSLPSKQISGLSKASSSKIKEEETIVESQSELQEDEEQVTPGSSSVLSRTHTEKTSTDQTTGHVDEAAETGLKDDEIRIEIPDKSVPVTPDDETVRKNTRIRHLQLYRAALSGDWNTAASIYDEYPGDISAKITKQGDTALHVAAAASNTSFVRKLVKKMTKEDLEEVNDVGNTAFHYAASSGNPEIAEVMISKNPELIMRRSADGLLPLHIAALSGHEDMTFLLGCETKLEDMNDEDKIELLVAYINSDLYDNAVILVHDFPKLAISRDRNGETALHALARKSITSSELCPCPQIMVGRIFELCKSLVTFAVRAKGHLNMKQTPIADFPHIGWSVQAIDVVKSIWEQVMTRLDDQRISDLIGKPWPPTFVAAEKGNFELLRLLIRTYPDIVKEKDNNGRTIFHVAVLNRQDKIFKLIYEIGPLKDWIVSSRDEGGNSLLHLAGMLPPMNRLNVVPGAALQMQLELIWFKEVRKIVRPSDAEAKNKDKKTPRDLFDESHKKLKVEGEKWMKDTANYCMVVAALVTTVVFAAAFTIPGGNKEDTGAPHFLRKHSFQVFVISDAISLIFSSFSILSFLSILTSTCTEEDFVWRLHRNLLLGFTLLFASIAAMMVVFCTTCFIIFNDEKQWIPILVTALASIPALFFTWQHFRVFVTITRSATLQSLS